MEVADAVAAALVNAGFDPYIATKQQTLRGLKENIFERLAETEYFLFIDFARERLAGVAEPNCRGSVFSQQELAVAASLDIEVVCFQEESVRPREGILAFLQANCTPFSERSMLPALIIEAVRQRGWSSVWQKCLMIDDSRGLHGDAQRRPENIPVRVFHLRIKNEHHRTTARNVFGYLNSVTDLRTGSPVVFETVEFKWAGYTLPSATIPASGYRNLDAFWLNRQNPNVPYFNTFSDSTNYIPRFEGPGEWRLDYSVISDNVPGASRSFRLSLDGTLDGVRFEPI